MHSRPSYRGSLSSMFALAAACATTTLACTSEDEDSIRTAAQADTTGDAAHRTTATGSPGSFTAFESGQVRPLAMSPDKQHLFAVNTPDNRLEVFRVEKTKLVHTASIPVGLEPVAVAARTDNEVWVVNHLSDSVSIVTLDDDARGAVTRTLLVGDEPRDIVFAGPSKKRAFITTAHRGQNAPSDPQLTTRGLGRADVWVFDAAALGTTMGGAPLTIVTLFTDTPRALTVTPDGTKVYAAGFHTGNRTTVVSEPQIPDGFGPGGVVGPKTNFQGIPAPEVSAIVKWNGSHWVDAAGYPQDQGVRLSLPDKDVFVLDAMASPPKQLAGPAGFYQGVGTILYSMAINPANGKVYVSNTDANNMDRFEGPGTFAGHSLRGHLHESRITVLSGTGNVAPRHLNKHIDYTKCCAPIGNAESKKSMALPQGMAVTSNGATLYVAALGSDKVGVYNTAQLENDTFVPDTANQIAVSGGGPTGLVLDEDRKQLFVMTRFDDGISIIDTTKKLEVGHVKLYNPEPKSITAGRRFLYDASFSSAHGDSSCATCHVFGDFDSLAWDLGDPDAEVVNDPGPFKSALFDVISGTPIAPVTHPMKGPMTTQSLRGMANHGPMHWRGDRTGGNDAPSVQPDSGAFDEKAGFSKFQGGFTELMGRDKGISAKDMSAFADFILQVTYPPNPIAPLDNSLTDDQQAGKELFFGTNCGIPACLDGNCPILTCESCHVLDPKGNPNSAKPGFYGTSGFSSFDFNVQLFKVPHLRNLYQKVGMFGMAPHPGIIPGDNDQTGDQVRGVGFLHDGEVDTVFRFHSATNFSTIFTGEDAGGIPQGPEGDVARRQLEAFLLAFPSNLAPAVGQQITLRASSPSTTLARIELLRKRADAGDCELVAKAAVGGVEAGFLYVGNNQYRTDRRWLPAVSGSVLQLLAVYADQPLTYTCVPLGSGERIGVDRDGDGAWDGDERDCGADPADPKN